MNSKLFKCLINLWPPLLFSGIHLKQINENYRELQVELKLRWYNRNLFGVHYGGSLMSMTDPWYMTMLIQNLGDNYFIWDKHAEIDYIAPGKTHVYAYFKLTPEVISEIKLNTATGAKYLPVFNVDIRDKHENLVAQVKRTVYIKLKPKNRNQ